MKFLNFFYFGGNFCPPGSGSNTGTVRIPLRYGTYLLSTAKNKRWKSPALQTNRPIKRIRFCDKTDRRGDARSSPVHALPLVPVVCVEEAAQRLLDLRVVPTHPLDALHDFGGLDKTGYQEASVAECGFGISIPDFFIPDTGSGVEKI